MTAPDARIRPASALEVPENHLRLVLETKKIVLSAATPVAVVGVRGFASKIGDVPEDASGNQIGVYDDPICVVTRSRVKTFLGNTDPSRTIEGRAILQFGVVEMGPGIHNRSKPAAERRFAFIQQSGVTIRRYNAAGELGPELHDQWIGCNNHDGSNTTTGSAACQTVVPEQWAAYVAMVLTELGIPVSELPTITTRIKQGLELPEHWAKARFPYVLTG